MGEGCSTKTLSYLFGILTIYLMSGLNPKAKKREFNSLLGNNLWNKGG